MVRSLAACSHRLQQLRALTLGLGRRGEEQQAPGVALAIRCQTGLTQLDVCSGPCFTDHHMAMMMQRLQLLRDLSIQSRHFTF